MGKEWPKKEQDLELQVCPLFSTFFCKVIIDAGESPENFEVNAVERKLLSFGSSIAANKSYVSDIEFEDIRDLYSTEHKE